MNAVSRVSSLSLALPVSVVSFTSFLSHSSPFFFSLLLSFLFLFPPTSLVVDFFLTPRSSSLSSHSLPFYSALGSSNPFISRSRFRGSVPFFSLPTCMLAPFSSSRPPRGAPNSPSRATLYARFSGFSCASPFRPPAYPLRNRSTETCSGVAGTVRRQQKEMGYVGRGRARYERPGRFKRRPQEKDGTAVQAKRPR